MTAPFTHLEQGDLYFLCRPRVQSNEADHLNQVQRLYLILKGDKNSYYRLIIVGKKQLPSYEERQVEFAFVDAIFSSSKELASTLQAQHYETKTRGPRQLAQAQVVAEGKYLLFKEGSSSYLAYQLDCHQPFSEIQKELGLSRQGNWIISVKNPNDPSHKGLAPEQKAHFPKELLERFEQRRFITLDCPDYLNYPGAELLLVAEKSSPRQKWGEELARSFNSFQHHESARALSLEKAFRAE